MRSRSRIEVRHACGESVKSAVAGNTPAPPRLPEASIASVECPCRAGGRRHATPPPSFWSRWLHKLNIVHSRQTGHCFSGRGAIFELLAVSSSMYFLMSSQRRLFLTLLVSVSPQEPLSLDVADSD